MLGRIVIALLLTSTIAFAKGPATNPSTAPTGLAASKPADHIPTPAELLAQIQAGKVAESKLIKVAWIDLDRPVLERNAEFSLLGDDGAPTLHILIDRLHQARDDKEIKALLITLGSTQFSLSQACELRDALKEVGAAGKRTFVFSNDYDTDAYTFATGATDVCILGGGEMMMPGVGLETMFAKGLLDKVGVKADYVQIGEFKGADEEYTRTGPSDEFRGELNKLIDSLYGQIVDGIATNRKIPADDVKAAIDQCLLTGNSAKERKLVDHLVDREGLRDLITRELGGDINPIQNYGEIARDKPDFSNPLAIFTWMARKPIPSGKPIIAIIHAEGTIVDGDGEGSLFGGSENVGGEKIRKAFHAARDKNRNIQAIVLRIDSPGGSALASEVMWQAVHRTAQDKPVVVSVGGMAASGGYYLASAGDYIFADPTAIVGSIGVVGGKFVTKDLFDKVGLSTANFTRGANADLFSTSQPFTEKQKAMVTSWMTETYEQFKQRVMTNRKDKIKDIDKVARGRVFTARQAKDLGMVDDLGGIEDAIVYAAKQVDLKPGEYEVQDFPASKTLGDLLTGGNPEDASTPIRPQMLLPDTSVLSTLPPSVRKMVAEQLQFMQILDRRPIMLVSPYVITVK